MKKFNLSDLDNMAKVHQCTIDNLLAANVPDLHDIPGAIPNAATIIGDRLYQSVHAKVGRNSPTQAVMITDRKAGTVEIYATEWAAQFIK